MPWSNAFPDKVNSDSTVMDEAVGQRYVPVAKILLQVLVIYKLSQVIASNYNYKWILMGILCTLSGASLRTVLVS